MMKNNIKMTEFESVSKVDETKGLAKDISYSVTTKSNLYRITCIIQVWIRSDSYLNFPLDLIKLVSNYAPLKYISQFSSVFKGVNVAIAENGLLAHMLGSNSNQSIRFQKPLINGVINKWSVEILVDYSYFIGVVSDKHTKKDFDKDCYWDSLSSIHGLCYNCTVVRDGRRTDEEYDGWVNNYNNRPGTNDVITIHANFMDENEKFLLYFHTKKNYCMNKLKPLKLNNDNQKFKEWYPVVSFTDTQTGKFRISFPE